MSLSSRLIGVWLLILTGVTSAFPARAAAQEFRVDTEIFENQDKKPILEQLTIFAKDGTIYDLRLSEPKEVTVFDLRRGVCTLLDEARRVKAVVTTQELLDVTLELQTHAEHSKSSLIAFCAAPKFEVSDKEVNRDGQTLIELQLAGKPLTYVIEAEKAQRAEAAKAYRQFADWCVRLNATVSGNLPPGARLAVNQAMAERGLLPLEVRRTIGKAEVRSQHRVNWTLCGDDHKKIEHASDMMANFQLLSYDEYRNTRDKPTPNKQTRR
jgi:hypothetical protein